jgi:hypothetical protein
VAKIVGADGAVVSNSNSFVINQLASPLALDLNGDGVQTTTLADGVQFDLLADGTPRQVSWLEKHDGFLALDLNNNGVVDSGAELLGTSTVLKNGQLAQDGWQALRDLDSNLDGVINAQDEAYLNLKVWVDGDSDGVTDTGELRSLADQGIQSISLVHDLSQTEQNGNILQGASSFTTTDGQNHQIVDAWLQAENAPANDAATFGPVNAAGVSAVDALKLSGSGLMLDLTKVTELEGMKGVESLDITGSGDNLVKLNLNSVLNMANASDNPATAVNEAGMLVINGDAGDVVQLEGGINWQTVTTGVSGEALTAMYGSAYNFVATDTYSQLTNGAGTLFIDESMTRTNV